MSIPLWLQCTHLLMVTSSRIMHHATKLKSSQTGFLNMTISSLYQLASTVTRSQSNRAPLGRGGTGDSHHGCAADKSAATARCYHVNMDQNLWGMFPTPCWIYATRIKVLKAKGAQPSTSKVYLIKWQVSVYFKYNVKCIKMLPKLVQTHKFERFSRS